MTKVIIQNSAYASVIQSHRSYDSGIVRKAVVAPHMRLRQFLSDNRNDMRRRAIENVKALIKESEGWKV